MPRRQPDETDPRLDTPTPTGAELAGQPKGRRLQHEDPADDENALYIEAARRRIMRSRDLLDRTARYRSG